jgi:hypothetical protein
MVMVWLELPTARVKFATMLAPTVNTFWVRFWAEKPCARAKTS